MEVSKEERGWCVCVCVCVTRVPGNLKRDLGDIPRLSKNSLL